MRILITGSSGQLGTEIAVQLSQKNTIIGIDVIPGAWTQHVMSITDRDAIDTLMKDIDVLIAPTANLSASLPTMNCKPNMDFD